MTLDVSQLTLAVMTVDREPQYVHQTLASLFASGRAVHDIKQIYLVVGSPSCEYVAHYRHHKNITIHALSNAEAKTIAEWKVHRRFCHNYARCLSLPIPPGGGICVCEDDVVFRDLFVERLVATVNEMEGESQLADYCLALFSCFDFEQEPSFYRGKRYCSYGYRFHGTQCMYYPRAVADNVRQAIQRWGVDDYQKPGDLLIQDCYGDRMYASPRALANHVGKVSTGLGGNPSAASFDREYVLLTPETWGK